MNKKRGGINKGFTLIELLVVISIIGIILAVSLFGMQGARANSRDARRKADLETIRSGLELYKSDHNTYPPLIIFGGSLVGVVEPYDENTYIGSIPQDPLSPSRVYSYKIIGSGYVICAALEGDGPGGHDDCACGDEECNYYVTNP